MNSGAGIIKYKFNTEFVLRKIGQVRFAVNTINNNLYELNNTSAEIFILLSQSCSIEQIEDNICKKYRVSKMIVHTDLQNVITLFSQIGVLHSPIIEGTREKNYVLPKRQLSYYVKKYWNPQEHPYKVKSFELTANCNFWCYHCYQGDLRETREMLDTATVKRIIDKMVEIGVLQLVLSGGDPLIRPDFIDIYRYAKQQGMLVRIFTNGSLITDSHLLLFKELPPERIIISLYGASEETYIKTTKKIGVYEKVINNIKRILRIGLPLSVKFIVSKITIQDFPSICKFVKDNHIELRYAFYIYPTNNNDSSVCNQMISVKEMLEIDILHQQQFNSNVARKKNSWLTFYKENGFVPQYLCNFPHCQFYVDFRGTVFACSSGLKKYGGDILKDSFDSIWKRFKKLRNEHMSRINECVGCKALFYCVNCPADEFSFYGDAELINEKMCLFAKAKYLYYSCNMSFVDVIKKLNL